MAQVNQNFDLKKEVTKESHEILDSVVTDIKVEMILSMSFSPPDPSNPVGAQTASREHRHFHSFRHNPPRIQSRDLINSIETSVSGDTGSVKVTVPYAARLDDGDLERPFSEAAINTALMNNLG